MLSPPHLNFVPDVSYQEAKPSNSDSMSPFNVSWPSTERSSSSPSEQLVGGKALSSLKLSDVSDGESVIARYIERFRYGQPTNRKERKVPSDPSSQFWWLGNSFVSEENISRKESSPSSDSSQSGVKPSLFSSVQDQSPLGDLQDISTLDPETVSLQERAARLLQRSTSPSGNSRYISSEGLGSISTSTFTNANVDLAGPTPEHRAAHQCKGSRTADLFYFTQRSHPSLSMKPEEDILFQWRLRQKMQEASKAAAMIPSIAWRSQCSQPPSASSMVERADVKSPETTNLSSIGRKVLPTSESKHLCCCTDSVRKEPSFRQITETTSFRNETVKAGSAKQGVKKLIPQEAAVPAYVNLSPIPEPIPSGKQEAKEQTLQKDCITAYLESSSPLRAAETSKHFNQTISCHGQLAAEPDKKMHTEPKGNQRPYRSKQDQAKPVTVFRELPIIPAKQSVQHALGEVVAERLFSPPESPACHRDKPKRNKKDWGREEGMSNTVATPSHPQLLDMAAQLLEQAEDSDGTEFEDDPLLQILRAQREVLRSQLRAVGLRMAQDFS
ncbi:proline and serine-rich protein 3 isoform X2 [Sceloporus undulatus]|nr:proline and serine-rich protein 3 isoform X2 [Sceloporus undulatus]XP_042296151.1 proline and serine-rich protein 3 isoform X2 [Sceloporus undulatus]